MILVGTKLPKKTKKLWGERDSQTCSYRRNVASRGASQVHMARLQSLGSGSTWKSLQVSAQGAFKDFEFLGFQDQVKNMQN